MNSRKPGTFGKGNRASVGNKGGGRNPDWLKAKCQTLIEKHKLIEFLADVASGEYLERVLTADSEVIVRKSCDADTRMKAINMLMERGYGKPAQAVEVAGKDGGDLIIKTVAYA